MRTSRPLLTICIWIALSFVTLFPIYWLFVISVKAPVDLFSTPDILLDGFYWKNYQTVLNDETLRRYMMNSIIIATGNAVLVCILAFMACYARCRATTSAARRTSSSGRSPTGWRRRPSSCCRSSCSSPRSS